jgi:hypothetical protein
MKLKAWDSQTGSQKLVSSPVQADISVAMRELDWNCGAIVGITLEDDGQNWADGSGSLVEGVGLSLMLEEDGVQYVSERAPSSLDEVREFLEVYLRGDIQRVYELLYGREFGPGELDALRKTSRESQGRS